MSAGEITTLKEIKKRDKIDRVAPPQELQKGYKMGNVTKGGKSGETTPKGYDERKLVCSPEVFSWRNCRRREGVMWFEESVEYGTPIN